jgi:HD superfamily phosphohydrolase
LTEFAKGCTRCDDKVLRELAEGLLSRRLFKATDVTGVLAPSVVDFCSKAKQIIAAAGYDTDFAFEHDAPSDTGYKLYNPDAENPATQIYVESTNGEQIELSQCSEAVHHLANKYTLVRYYYPADAREQIREEAEPLLMKE